MIVEAGMGYKTIAKQLGESGEESALNYLGGSCQWPQGHQENSWQHTTLRRTENLLLKGEYAQATEHLKDENVVIRSSTQLVFREGGEECQPSRKHGGVNIVLCWCFSAKGTKHLCRARGRMDGPCTSQSTENGSWAAVPAVPARQWSKTYGQRNKGLAPGETCWGLGVASVCRPECQWEAVEGAEVSSSSISATKH